MKICLSISEGSGEREGERIRMCQPYVAPEA